MRLHSIVCVLLGLGAALSAQGPSIGIIDFYGLQKVPETKVRQALGVREGDPLPRSKGDSEERIDGVSGVVEAHLEAVCCDAGRMILYVGVEEKGAPHFDLRDPPEGDVQLPEDVTTTYRRFLEASQAAARRGVTAEDLTQGHALSADPDTRAIQEQFEPVVRAYLGDLRHVLRDSNDEEQRAIAVYVIAYAANQKEIVNDLQSALKDADAGVRMNATHGLKALAVRARLNPEAGVPVSPTWFIEMLNSLSWTDRNQALGILQILTDPRSGSRAAVAEQEETLEQIRERALASVIEMARWKSLPHALPAYVLLARVAGLTDQQAQDAWSRGDRESVIAQVNAPKKKNSIPRFRRRGYPQSGLRRHT